MGIKKEDLEHLTSNEIKQSYLTDDVEMLPNPIKDYVIAGKLDFTMGNRLNRVEKLLNLIVVERFIKGTL